MKLSGKAIAAILVIAALAIAAIIAQKNSFTSTRSYNLSAKEMEALIGEIMPPIQQQQLASSPEQRKELAGDIKKSLALAQEAERNGFADKSDLKTQIDLRTDAVLSRAYNKKNPDVKIGDEEITKYVNDHKSDFDKLFDAIPQLKAQASGPQGDSMKKEISQIRLFAERARKDKIDQQESTKLLTFLVRSDILASAYLDDLRKSDKLVSDEEIAKYYNEHKDEFEEVRARHILISTQAPPPSHPGTDDKDKKEAPKALSKDEAKKKAQSILDRIRKGEDFAKLAEENSDDPGSKTKGGDLDYFPKGAMVREFDQAAFSLQPGQVSDLVETQFGYHIIKVEDHRTKGLDDQDTKKQIADKLKQDKIQERIKEITDKSNVQVAEDFNITVKPEDLQASPPPQLPQQSPAPAPQNEKSEKPATGKNAKPSTDKKK